MLWGWGHVPADILSEKFLYFFTWLVIIEGGNFSARLPVIHKTDEGHISGYKKDNLSTIEAFWNIIFQKSEPLVWQKEEKAKLEIIFQVTGTGIPHNVILLCSTQTFSVFDEIQPNKLQYVNLNHHSERFDVMIEQIFINIVWNIFELGHSWINEQRNWIFHITTVFTSTFLSYTSKPETLIKHLSELEKKKKSEALILGLKLYMYNVHAYMHIMQCTICNFGFYSLGRISSANLHIFAFISDEMHVIAIFDQKRVKLHFPGDIKYIADSSRCLPFPVQC